MMILLEGDFTIEYIARVETKKTIRKSYSPKSKGYRYTWNGRIVGMVLYWVRSSTIVIYEKLKGWDYLPCSTSIVTVTT